MNNQTIKCKVVMLPQNQKATDLFIKSNGELEYNVGKPPLYGFSSLNWKSQNLYIISDREIKKGDWMINNNKDTLVKCNIVIGTEHFKKVEATTDKELHAIKFRGSKIEAPSKILKGVKVIPQSFIKAYVDAYNSSKVIEDVFLEMELYYSDEFGNHSLDLYKIKTRPNNTVIIHSIKDSWNREEVIKLIKATYSNAWYMSEKVPVNILDSLIDDWIKQNL